jgi:hypothetical protein
LGARMNGISPTVDEAHKRISLICGTSSCHLVMSDKPIFVPGKFSSLSCVRLYFVCNAMSTDNFALVIYSLRHLGSLSRGNAAGYVGCRGRAIFDWPIDRLSHQISSSL